MSNVFRLKVQTPTHAQECASLMQWVRVQQSAHPALRWFAHIAHENKDAGQRVQGWKEGVNPGIPDYVFPVSRGTFSCLWIEMKRRDPADKLTEDQALWRRHLCDMEGHIYLMTRGWEVAQQALLTYLYVPAELVSPFWRDKAS